MKKPQRRNAETTPSHALSEHVSSNAFHSVTPYPPAALQHPHTNPLQRGVVGMTGFTP